MSVLSRRHWCRLLVIFTLIFSLMLSNAAMAVHLKDDLFAAIGEHPFSVLILGDSQMAGAGWEGGYANCILEIYPNAQVFNLAKNGSLLANGDLHAQWEIYLTEDCPMTDFVLLDGGVNDLPYLKREEYKDTGLELVKEAFCSLIEQIHEVNPDAQIIYTLMPPLEEWKDSQSGPPSYEAQKSYWKQMNIVASAYDYVNVLDLFSLNPFRFPCAECYHEYFADSIHFSEAGYRKTFEYLDNMLVTLMAQKLSG